MVYITSSSVEGNIFLPTNYQVCDKVDYCHFEDILHSNEIKTVIGRMYKKFVMDLDFQVFLLEEYYLNLMLHTG